MYPGTTKATSKKNQVQRCFRFPGILLSEGGGGGEGEGGYNDTHYEIIGVDVCLYYTCVYPACMCV